MSLQSSYRNWRTYRNTVASLNKLNDRQLADLGIQRHNINETAKRSVY